MTGVGQTLPSFCFFAPNFNSSAVRALEAQLNQFHFAYAKNQNAVPHLANQTTLSVQEFPVTVNAPPKENQSRVSGQIALNVTARGQTVGRSIHV